MTMKTILKILTLFIFFALGLAESAAACYCIRKSR